MFPIQPLSHRTGKGLGPSSAVFLPCVTNTPPLVTSDPVIQRCLALTSHGRVLLHPPSQLGAERRDGEANGTHGESSWEQHLSRKKRTGQRERGLDSDNDMAEHQAVALWWRLGVPSTDGFAGSWKSGVSASATCLLHHCDICQEERRPGLRLIIRQSHCLDSENSEDGLYPG